MSAADHQQLHFLHSADVSQFCCEAASRSSVHAECMSSTCKLPWIYLQPLAPTNLHLQITHTHTHTHTNMHTHTHTHTHLMALFPGLPGWAGTRKVKPIWILLKQETVSSSGISWAICKCAPRSRQITMPAPHHSVFYRPDALPAHTHAHAHTHTHTLNGPFSGTTRVSQYQKGKTNLDLTEARDS